MNRHKITVTLECFDYSMPLDKVEEIIQSAKQRAKRENIKNLYFQIDYERGYYNEVDIKINITGKRLETDEEIKLRLQEEKNDLEWKRKQYEQLKKELHIRD